MDETRTMPRWVQLTALVALAVSAPATAQTSGAPVTTKFAGLVYNRATQTFNSVLTITNNGPTLYAPLSISISTNVATVTVSGAGSGGTISLAPLPSGRLLPSATVQLAVAFVDPTRVTFIPTVTQVTGAAAPSDPTAVVDAPSAVVAYSTVVLDGASAGDPTASIQSYSWTQTSGPTVTLTGANAAQASFTAPQVTALTSLTFKLTVTDANGSASSAAATIFVSPATAAQLAVTFVSAHFLAPVQNNLHTNYTSADGPPLAGSTSEVMVTLTGALQSPNFTVVDVNGNVLSTPTLTAVGTPSFQPLSFAGLITVPTVAFTFAASGTTADGQSYAVKLTPTFAPKNMSISFSPADLSLAPGVSGTGQLNIYNGGATATFTIQYNDPFSLLSAGAATSIEIAASTSASVPITVTYPANTTGVIGPTVTATASVSGDATRTGTATLTLWQGVAQ